MQTRWFHPRGGCLAIALAAGMGLLLAGVGCGAPTTQPGDNQPPDTNTPPDSGDPTNPPDGGDDGGNVLLNESLGSEGSLSGEVSTSQSTRESTTDESAGQAVPPDFDTANTCVRFKDLLGQPLLDANGEPIHEVPVEPDGSFQADNLPVGVDITVCVDIGKDDTCEIESCVNVPSDDGGPAGHIDGVQADPLTTLILAKLRRLIEEKGLDPRDLPISPVAVVTRIVDAYTHLWEDSGIDDEIGLAEIEDAIGEELGALFDELLPAGARSGMDIVEGNIAVARAENVEARAMGAAEVFLRSGFPLSDLPGALDLTPLEEIEGVEALPREAFFSQEGDVFEEIKDEAEVDGDIVPAAVGMIYYIPNVEPDRNFSRLDGNEEGGEGDAIPQLPVINDHFLLEMTRLGERGARVTLGDLYDVLTDLEGGLGARLTYMFHDPNFFGPPLNVFETADGKGKAMQLERLFQRLFDARLNELTPEEFQQKQAEIRQILAAELGDTIPPAFDRLFRGFTADRVQDAREFARRLREARAHLPFNRFGPSTFFVVADGDPFRRDPGPAEEDGTSTVNPVSVDAVITRDGEVESVTYNPSGDGAFYLSFTRGTDVNGIVELFVREAGRPLHGRRGPARLDMNDASIFQPVDGEPFIDFVSDTGVFYPGTHVSVVRDEYAPDAEFGGDGPHQQMFVLATHPGEGAEPVRVDYDPTTGMVTSNPGGRMLLMFLPDSHETGVFALFNEDTGRPAGARDPQDFFEGPVDRPEGFEDFYNDVEDFEDFQDFENIDDFVDERFPPPPPPPDGEDPPPPPDGEEPPPPDGEQPPPDGEEPPPPDGEEPPPPDGEDPVDPAEDEDPPIDGEEPPIDGEEPPLDGDVPPPPDGEQPPPPPPGDGTHPDFILIAVDEIVGLDFRLESFTQVFGIEVPNPRYHADGDPYYDDVNENETHDEGEPTAPFRPLLFDPHDWRSTDIRLYYRRADNGNAVLFDNVDFESLTPMTRDGVELVRRIWRPRPNAFRFGRPNTAINMLTAFVPPEFFNGTHSLNRETRISPFMAIALINLVMDQVFNVEADIDIDGLGPAPRRRMLMDAHLFVLPIGDPIMMILDGLRDRAEFPPRPEPGTDGGADGGTDGDADGSSDGDSTDGTDGETDDGTDDGTSDAP